MSRFMFLAAAPLLLIALPSDADAQRNRDRGGERCDNARNSAGRQVGRSILGGLARSALGGIGGAAVVAFPMTDMLSDAIIDLLDCREQRKASEATDEAIRGGVGTTATWTSESRPNVSGQSVATGEETLADGSHCMTVTDVVIIDGEETRAPKRMCRQPGSARYARV